MNERLSRLGEIFAAFLGLGCTAFGGPVAHLAYFNAEFVRRRKWLDQDAYGHALALCQLLPGPTSSQLGIIIGLIRGGWLGAGLAWVAFTLPSAMLLVAFALGIAHLGGVTNAAWLHGLLIAAVAVVAAAVTTMARSLCPDTPRKVVALAVAAIVLLVPAGALIQLGLIVAGAAYGSLFIAAPAQTPQPVPVSTSRTAALLCGVVFCALLIGLPFAPHGASSGVPAVFQAFFTSGALVFGGGHVVLPLLETRVVQPGWISPQTFLAGYAAAQAVPGPLFTFAAFLGAAMHGPSSGIGGALLALFAISLPSFLLIVAALPIWNRAVRHPIVVRALGGVNAVVVGLLLAALYAPLWVNAIHAPLDAALALVAFSLLEIFSAPSWFVVGLSAAVAQALGLHR